MGCWTNFAGSWQEEPSLAGSCSQVGAPGSGEGWPEALPLLPEKQPGIRHEMGTQAGREGMGRLQQVAR